MSEAYRPVQCAFHDVLEDAAVRRRTCVIRYHAPDGALHETITTIDDVFARDGAEYVRLGTGPDVRLDRLDGVEPVEVRAPGVGSSGGAT